MFYFILEEHKEIKQLYNNIGERIDILLADNHDLMLAKNGTNQAKYEKIYFIHYHLEKKRGR